VSQRILVPSLIVLGLWTFIAFSSALSNGFVNWDDPHYLELNPAAQHLDLVGIFTDEVAANYQPLSVLTLAVEHRLFGMDPFVFHLGNVLLHVANTVLVALLVLRLLPGRLVVALVTAALFGLHPLHVESVAWISERKDVLSVFLSLGSLLAYVSYVDGGGRRPYALALAAFALALLAKPMAVTLPVVLLGIDWLRRRGLGRRVWIEKAPFFAGSLLAGVANLRIQSPDTPHNLEIYGLGWLERAWMGVEGIAFYVAKAMWPVRLSAVYDIDQVRVGALEWTLALAAAGFVAALLVRAAALRRAAVFGLAFFAITIALVLKVVPFGSYSLYNDRYMYLPSVGLFLVVALAFADAARWRPALRIGAAVVGGLALVALSVASYERCRVWRSSETLWSDALAVQPGATTALNNLGRYRLDAGDLEAAEALFERAVASRPESPDPHYNLAILYARRGDRAAAERAYERALELHPGSAPWRMEVARFYASGGDFARAVKHYEAVVELLPDSPEVRHNLGDLYMRLGQTGRARAAYEEALRLAPDLGPTHAALGRLHLQQGDERRALAAFERARAAGTQVDEDLLRRLRARHPNVSPSDSPPRSAGGGV